MNRFETVDLLAAARALKESWSPRIVGCVNDQYVKVAKLRGEFVWHAHEAEDELFLVLEGTLRMQIEGEHDRIVPAGSFVVVPRGARHNPIAEHECLIALIETVTTAHTGDVVSSRTRTLADQLPR